MKCLNARRLFLSWLCLSGLLVLGACSGDGRPFEEAVEVQMLDLESLQVIPPARTTDDPYFAVGQVVDFRVRGSNTAGGDVELSGVDREWRVSDSSVATIDSNGRLMGRSPSNGQIAVDLIIGGIVSASYSFNVSDAELQTILPVVGSDTLDPCLPMEYSAMGMFSDSTRPLYDVEWSVDPEASVRILGTDQGVIDINGIVPNNVYLTATSAGVSSQPLEITIRPTLNTISVTPVNLGLQVGSTRDMVATGSYADGVTRTPGLPVDAPPTPIADTTNNLLITDTVVWSLTDGSNLASISNAVETRGQLTASATGTVTVSASCGAVPGSSTLTISAGSSTTSSSGLSFVSDEIDDSNGQLFVSLMNDSSGIRVRLNDSDGNNVTTQADWSLSRSSSDDTSSTEDNIRVGNGTTDKGLITPLLQGGPQDVRVEFEGAVATLSVQVTQ